MGTNHLADAEAEVLRITVSPRNEETQRRVLELKAIVAEHRVGNQTTQVV